MSADAYVGELVKWSNMFEELMGCFVEGRRLVDPRGTYLAFRPLEDAVCLDNSMFADLDSGDRESVYQLYGEALDLVEDGKNLRCDLSGSKDEIRNFYGGVLTLSKIFFPIAYFDNGKGRYEKKIDNKPLFRRALHLGRDTVELARKAGLGISHKTPLSGVKIRRKSAYRQGHPGPNVPAFEFPPEEVERLAGMILHGKDWKG